MPVDFFAVWLVILPATKQNANPLESQSPHDRISRLAVGALLLVISFGPGRGADGMRPVICLLTGSDQAVFIGEEKANTVA